MKRGVPAHAAKTGTGKSPHRSAFNTHPFDACLERMSCVVEITGFVLDSSRSYVNCVLEIMPHQGRIGNAMGSHCKTQRGC